MSFFDPPAARSPRVLLAKPGMDGHNRGINVVMRALLDSGCQVIYLGIRKSAVQIVAAAVQEDAYVIGLSMLSGAHIGLTEQILAEMDREGIRRTPLVVGGIVPDDDVEELLRMGVSAVFTPGTSLREITDSVWKLAAPRLAGVAIDTAGNDGRRRS